MPSISKKRRRIIRNIAECFNCGEIIESKHVSESQTCKCLTTPISIGGGKEYHQVYWLNEHCRFKAIVEYDDGSIQKELYPDVYYIRKLEKKEYDNIPDLDCIKK